MSWFYRHAVRPVLFAQEAEQIHNRTMRMLAFAGRYPATLNAIRSFFAPSDLPVNLFGLRFPNPVGLAAGMDKNAEALPAWSALGFGFTELGAATWRAQPGNPKPRTFRAISEGAIVNRMGFNNVGAEAIAAKLMKWKSAGLWPNHPVGMNLGKSKITPLNEAPEDYANSFRALRSLLDFFVVNVSSPNTPNLRQLQDKAALDEIFAAIQEINFAKSAKRAAPILVKVAPDLSFDALDEILELTGPRNIAGIVATNTTISRPQTGDAAVQHVYSETGGLSGRPLQTRSTEIVRHLYRQTRGQLPIIGVGGIFSADDAWEKITAGASLIQIYTGFVYEGPGLIREIVEGLTERLEQHGLSALRQAIGIKAN
jgi:dihydroorotate dehydrogenase